MRLIVLIVLVGMGGVASPSLIAQESQPGSDLIVESKESNFLENFAKDQAAIWLSHWRRHCSIAGGGRERDGCRAAQRKPAAGEPRVLEDQWRTAAIERRRNVWDGQADGKRAGQGDWKAGRGSGTAF